MTKQSWAKVIKSAFITSLPVMAGYVVLGAGFGIMLNKAGYGIIWALAMSVFIYAGSMQYVGAGLMASSVSLLTAFVMTISINARHLFYGISMLKHYDGAGRKKPYLIFALTDETYSLICDGSYPPGVDKYAYFFLVSGFNQIYWVVGSLIGSIAAALMRFNSAGIEFSMTALFVASFAEQWTKKENRLPGVIGIVCTLVCLLVVGRDNFLIPSMILITAALALVRVRRNNCSNKVAI